MEEITRCDFESPMEKFRGESGKIGWMSGRECLKRDRRYLAAENLLLELRIWVPLGQIILSRPLTCLLIWLATRELLEVASHAR